MNDGARQPIRIAPSGTIGRGGQSVQSFVVARRLHLGHVAFMRAVVQGLDTRASWNRYLRSEGEHDDARNVRRTVQWIRDEFAAAAKRHQRYGLARLVSIDAALVAEQGSLPSLEGFAAEHDLLDFSEAEQLEYYQERYGKSTGRQNRRASLIARQLEALGWLEQLVGGPPRADDPLDAWLHPDLAVRLNEAGLHTLRGLAARINGVGLRWWAGIQAIGATKARRITDWLRAHEETTGLKLGGHVGVKRSQLSQRALAQIVPAACAIVPLEKLIIPPALDGSTGAFRAPRDLSLIDVERDIDALLLWLKGKRGLSAERKAALSRHRGSDPGDADGPLDWLNYLSNTQRAYRKEAERFLLWAVVQHKKALSSMTAADCAAYLDFLANPSPADQWCAPRGHEKWSPLWRPFEGPLSSRARRQAAVILKGFYQFLGDQRYLVGNPWNGVVLPQIVKQVDSSRSFSHEQWAFIQRQLTQLPATSANTRLSFALTLLYGTGMRLTEAVLATVDDLRPREGDESPRQWELVVRGKGETLRGVPLPSHVADALAAYLLSRGLHADPGHPHNKGAYVLGKASDLQERAPWACSATDDPKQGIAAGTLYGQLKAFFTECARRWPSPDSSEAKSLKAASTHWLRHTHGMHSAKSGKSLSTLRAALGHASLGTTTIYLEDTK